MMLTHDLSRKLRQLPNLTPQQVYQYMAGRVQRWEDRFHQRRVKSLTKFEIPRDVALVQATRSSTAAVEEAEREFDALQPYIASYLAKSAAADSQLAASLYTLVRLIRPRVVVETGVWHGVSSFAILSALDKVDSGRLVSIDFPPMNPDMQVEIGKAVPERLRSRWTLHLGPSRYLLPKVIGDVNEITLFVHDSSHTYRNMRMEFRTVWSSLSLSGCIVSDDIHSNDAFLEFAMRVDRRPLVFSRAKGGYIGLIVK